jgi:hypothetical protein
MGETRTKSSTGGEKGVKLARFDLIPVGPLTELAEHYGVGASKYDNHQWRQGYEWSKSYAALMRHLTAFWAGFDYDLCSNDPDGCSHVDTDGNPFVAVRDDACFNHTGSHHLAAVAWHSFCLLEFKDAHQDHDDRYPPGGQPPSSADDEQAAINAAVDMILDRQGAAPMVPQDEWLRSEDGEGGETFLHQPRPKHEAIPKGRAVVLNDVEAPKPPPAAGGQRVQMFVIDEKASRPRAVVQEEIRAALQRSMNRRRSGGLLS